MAGISTPEEWLLSLSVRTGPLYHFREQSMSFQPPPPRTQPGVVIAAAVMTYISAGLEILIGLSGLVVGAALAGLAGGWGGVLILASLATLATAGFLIAGAIKLQTGTDRRILIRTLVLATTLFGIFNIVTAAASDDSGGGILCTLLISIPWPATIIYLVMRPESTRWLESPRQPYGGAPGVSTPSYAARGYVAAFNPAVLLEPVMTDALAEYGRRAMTGQPLWVGETAPLSTLRNAISAGTSGYASATIAHELEKVARKGPWHAVGVWRFVADHDLPNRQRTTLPGQFKTALRTLLNDPTTPTFTYRFDEFEAGTVRGSEPRDSPLWRLMPLRSEDLVPHEPPAAGEEPHVDDLGPHEQRLLANLGPNRLLASRTADGGYLAVLARIGAAPDAAGEVFAHAPTLTGLLRSVGDRLGRNVTDAIVSTDLAPYVRWRRPDWWPGAEIGKTASGAPVVTLAEPPPAPAPAAAPAVATPRPVIPAPRIGELVAVPPQLEVALVGHSDAVLSMTWSPDGGQLASAGGDRLVRIWNARSGNLVATLAGHTDAVRSVAWSPDGALLATAGTDRTTRLWDVASGTEVRVLTGHQSYVFAASWSPDGAGLATAGWDKTVILWRPTTGERLQTLAGHSGDLYAVAWSPDGEQLATASADNTAGVWHAPTAERRLTLPGHTNAVKSVAWSPDGTRLVTGSADGTARIWDAATGTPQRTLTCGSAVRSVAWSPSGTFVATSGADGSVAIWDVSTSQPSQRLADHTGMVSAVAWSPDGTRLATADEGTIRVWHVAQPR
jgi:WD40 repeat protein